MRTTMAIVLAVAGARAAAACATTPELDFVSDASTLDAPAPSDATASDASDDGADAADAGDARVVRNTCPDAAPPNVAMCCGRVRCVGKGCDQARCDDCKVCAVTSVCCMRTLAAASECLTTIAACK